MLRNGIGTEKDEATALFWIQKAAFSGLKEAQAELAKQAAVAKPVKRSSASITVDPSTGLAWQDTPDAANREMLYKDAVKYCKQLEINGVIGWRMPSVKEMLSLIDPKKKTVRLKFTSPSDEVYWTSQENKTDARVVYMFNGCDYYTDKMYYNRVRCVRNK